jgi:ABC-type oligopeptide transport system substrate-binding subunit
MSWLAASRRLDIPWTASPSTFFEDLFTCSSRSNVLDDNSFYCNKTADKAIDTAETLDGTDQIAAGLAWAAARRQVLLDAPIIPTVQSRSTCLSPPGYTTSRRSPSAW